MNYKRVALTGIVLAIVYAVMQFLTHGVLLADIYMQTASIWRPEAEMMQYMCWMYVGYFIFAVMFAIIFAKGYDKRAPKGQGLRFGLLMALLIAPFSALSWFVILPIPMMLAVYWFIADFVQMVVLGVVADLIYKP